MTDVHQCPACELRFRFRTELEYHLAEDHQPLPRPEVEPAPDEPDHPDGAVGG